MEYTLSTTVALPYDEARRRINAALAAIIQED
jgi:hypothetical protein